ncbi:hypothetical protein SK128_025026 [Halocaridina rubra]|uniref:Uncharacterized protein n=1 Tax=Halocaridina rubra TaxID=373956 RepID=A0AAN8WRX7_HALRR
MRLFISLLGIVLLLKVAKPMPRQSNSALENFFDQRPKVEAIISCFLGRTRCTQQQDYIRTRAIATMRNFGRCPDNLCTPQERMEMEQSMLLLQSKHPDLFVRLVASILNVNIDNIQTG